MNQQAWEILLKFAPISGSIIFLGYAALKVGVSFFKEELAKKDKTIERKDAELKELNLQLITLITKNIEVANALKAMIKKALNKIPDDDNE